MMTVTDDLPEKTKPPLSRGRMWRRRALVLLAALVVIFVGQLSMIFLVGLRDQVGLADMIVVPGNTVHPNGKPSSRLVSRLDCALQLYHAGYAPLILVSGGFGKEGFEEAHVMRDWLIARSVPPEAILVDTDGYTTWYTARKTAAVFRERGLSRALVVTHYYHILRARLALERHGVPVVLHARAKEPPTLREPFALARECVGYWYYLFRPMP